MKIDLTFNINKKIVNNNQTKNTALGTNATETITITPPLEQICKINNLYINIPPVDSPGIGDHTLTISTQNLGVSIILSAFDSVALTLRGLSITSGGNSSIGPQTDIGIAMVLAKLIFSNSNPLIIEYKTTSDTQDNLRTYNVQYIAEAETNF